MVGSLGAAGQSILPGTTFQPGRSVQGDSQGGAANRVREDRDRDDVQGSEKSAPESLRDVQKESSASEAKFEKQDVSESSSSFSQAESSGAGRGSLVDITV